MQQRRRWNWKVTRFSIALTYGHRKVSESAKWTVFFSSSTHVLSHAWRSGCCQVRKMPPTKNASSLTCNLWYIGHAKWFLVKSILHISLPTWPKTCNFTNELLHTLETAPASTTPICSCWHADDLWTAHVFIDAIEPRGPCNLVITSIPAINHEIVVIIICYHSESASRIDFSRYSLYITSSEWKRHMELIIDWVAFYVSKIYACWFIHLQGPEINLCSSSLAVTYAPWAKIVLWLAVWLFGDVNRFSLRNTVVSRLTARRRCNNYLVKIC